jgi:hypothetical protein
VTPIRIFDHFGLAGMFRISDIASDSASRRTGSASAVRMRNSAGFAGELVERRRQPRNPVT